MKRPVLIIAILALVVLAVTAQTRRLLQTNVAPKAVRATLYYPGNTPSETVDLPVQFQVPVENWDWSVKDNCLTYKTGGAQDTTFCGTFKIVRSYE